jgi:hypothetical protein
MPDTAERLLQGVIHDLAADVQSMHRYILCLEEGRTQRELMKLRLMGRAASRPKAVHPATEVARGD